MKYAALLSLWFSVVGFASLPLQTLTLLCAIPGAS
jgi:hypothetical protein